MAAVLARKRLSEIASNPDFFDLRIEAPDPAPEAII
jgi:hypothetical protein